MVIKQTYIVNKEIFQIIINGKKVSYKDRKLPQPIQMIPKDKRVEKAILTSRNKIDKKLIEQFNLTKEEQEEYDSAIASGNDFEERLSEICKKDCQKSRAKLLKEEKD